MRGQIFASTAKIQIKFGKERLIKTVDIYVVGFDKADAIARASTPESLEPNLWEWRRKGAKYKSATVEKVLEIKPYRNAGRTVYDLIDVEK